MIHIFNCKRNPGHNKQKTKKQKREKQENMKN